MHRTARARTSFGTRSYRGNLHLASSPSNFGSHLGGQQIPSLGSGTTHVAKSTFELESLLEYLVSLAATGRSTPFHPVVRENEALAEFLVDRLRACQADAGRLMGTCAPVPPHWHVQLLRTLLWIQYWTTFRVKNIKNIDNEWCVKTLHTMIATAMEEYWETQQLLPEHQVASLQDVALRLDDEVHAYSVLVALAKDPLGTNYSSLLLDISERHTQRNKNNNANANCNQHYQQCYHALELASCASRGEYWSILHHPCSKNFSSFPLFALALAPGLPVWRYRTLQYYNRSFAKNEIVHDLDRLLNMTEEETEERTERLLEYSIAVGLPTTRLVGDNEKLAVVCKQVAMPDEGVQEVPFSREDEWIFGDLYAKEESMGVSGETLTRLLLHGRVT